MDDNIVYRMDGIMDDPRFEGFGHDDQPSLRGKEIDITQDFYPDSDELGWQAPRLAGIWKPFKVFGRVRLFNDYPCIVHIPAFSQRAVEALRDLLEPNGELLPVNSDLGTYYAYNITTVADVLNRRRSLIHWMSDDPGPWDVRAIWIERHEFFARKLKGLTIFRIPEVAGDAYVTEAFVDRVRERGLKGFEFAKVWPLPAGVDWMKLRKRQRRRRERRELPKGQRLKGNSVYIRLGLKSERPTDAERKEVDRLMDELDEQLVDRNSEAPPVGNLEGHDYKGGECRLLLSCPDADALAQQLMPWLRSLKWQGSVRAVKRYDEYVVEDAQEKVISIGRET